MDPLEKILEQTFTKRQLIKRTRVLKDFLSYLLFENPNADRNNIGETINQYLQYKQNDATLYNSILNEKAWLISLGVDFYIKMTPLAFTQTFETLEKELKDLKSLIVYLPKEIPEQEEFRLGAWLKTNISKRVIFEINLDPNLVGGCALSYRGNYKDYSLRQKISESHQLLLDNLNALKG